MGRRRLPEDEPDQRVRESSVAGFHAPPVRLIAWIKPSGVTEADAHPVAFEREHE